MIVRDFACLLVNNTRSKAYLQKLVTNGLMPERALYVELSRSRRPARPPAEDASPVENTIQTAFRKRKYFLYGAGPQAISPASSEPESYRTFDPKRLVHATLDEHHIPFESLAADSLNDSVVVDAVRGLPQRYVLFSGGSILREEILGLGKRFIHIHPGLLPYVRGSMAIEWSILLRGRCAVTAFFMVPGIDEGDVIASREFEPPPLEHGNIPPLFSSHMRSELLVEIVRDYVEDGAFPSRAQDRSAGTTLYKMHPTLGNIVLHACLHCEGDASREVLPERGTTAQPRNRE